MASHPYIPQVHRASVAPHPHHRRRARRAPIANYSAASAPTAPTAEPNGAIGLVYGLPISLALWGCIAALVHFL